MGFFVTLRHMKKQVLVIHGAGAFASLDRSDFITSLKNHSVDINWFRRGTGDWKAHLQEHLGEGFDVLIPKMPDPDNPHYDIWKTWFEKIIVELDEEVMLVGHSLGGAFLVKYLSEEKMNKKVQGVFIVAAPYLTDSRYGGFALQNIPILDEGFPLFFYYSKDDAIVSFENASQFKNALPHATVRELDSRGHFNKDNFPEIVEDISA